MFKTISKNAVAELVEKKSKFIASIFYIETIEQAEEIIKKVKKKYFDARHNCFAYRVIQEGEIISRFSDDGEPSGTAGAPILNLIEKSDIVNTLIIVTRYFGGILLGTGGLVKAYTDSSKLALEASKTIYKDEGLEVAIKIAYSDFEKFQYYMNKNNIKIISNEYIENIKSIIEISEEKIKKIIKNKRELNFEVLDLEILGKKIIDINSEI